MTYCVAMCLSDGLVFASDSRTNAGVDHIATFKKLHVFHQDGERVMVLQSAGNLATTQSVISLLSARIRTQQEPNLMQVTSLYDAAMLIGKTLQEVIQRDASNQQNCGNTNFNCNLLLGGQIAGECEEPTYLILTRNTGSSGNKSKQLGIFRSLQVGIEKNNVTFYLIPYLWIT